MALCASILPSVLKVLFKSNLKESPQSFLFLFVVSATSFCLFCITTVFFFVHLLLLLQKFPIVVACKQHRQHAAVELVLPVIFVRFTACIAHVNSAHAYYWKYCRTFLTLTKKIASIHQWGLLFWPPCSLLHMHTLSKYERNLFTSGWPKKVSHCQKSSLNRIKTRHCGYICHQLWI